MESVLEIIRNIYPDLAPSKKRVASYFMNNYSTLFMDTVTELAEKIGVSDTTVINFCNEMGFQGYSDFRKTVKREVLTTAGEGMQKASSESTEGFIEEITKNIIEGIRKTVESGERNGFFEKASDLLGNAEKIYCVGFWTGAGTARSMALRLNRAGYPADSVYPDMGGFIDQIRWSKEGEVAIVYDCSRYITVLTEICTILRSHGVKIILVTDTGPCPRLSLADAVIQCETGKTDGPVVPNVNSQIAVVNNILFSFLLKNYRKEADSYDIEVREGVFTRFNPYGVIEPDVQKSAPEF